MTTPGGVPNLPKGALTVGTLGSSLQDHTPEALRARANERVPTIFDNSTGGNILNDLSPFGIITGIWSAVNSLIAGADPADIQGPEDIPELLIDFIEGLPFVGQFVTLLTDLLAALQGEYEGTDEILLAIQSFLAPLIAFLKHVFDGFLAGFLSTGSTFLKAVFDWLGFFWGLFGEAVEGVLNPILEFIKWAWEKLDEIVGGTADQILRAITNGIMWVWVNIGEPVVKAIGGVIEWIVGVIDIDLLKSILEDITAFLGRFFDPQQFAEVFKTVFGFFANLYDGASSAVDFVSQLLSQIPLIGPLFTALTGKTEADGVTPSLASLAIWGAKVLTNTSQIPANNLFGQIPQALLSMVPVANINIDSANLLSQGDFGSAATVEAANGWSWDSTANDPDNAASKGSAKLTTNGTANQLYSRQAVRVAGGDKLKLSARVKTAAYSGSAGSIRLSLIPFAGTTAQSEVVFASRGASNGTWVTMTGADAYDPWVVPDGVTSVIVKIGVTSASGTGGTVWFDNVDLRKEGLLGQNLVEYLLQTWESAWDRVFGGGGTGKTWLDFAGVGGVLNQIFGTAGLGVTKGEGALGFGVEIVDAIGKAIFGEATYNTMSSQVKTAMQFFINKLFGVNTVQNKVQPAAVPPLSGSIIADGEVSIGVLPTDDIGAEINPSSASGAQLSRRDTNNSNATGGQNRFPTGFYTNVDVSGVDVAVLNSSNATVTGTGAKSNLAGVFKALTAGWYLVEICVRINPPVSFGTRIAPVLYRSGNYPTSPLDVYKVGADGVLAWWGTGGAGPRYVQSSFIVFLPAGGAVAAGYDCQLTTNGMFDADADGTQTYFSIALLNKTYA